jgi:hypothetical protein
VRRHTQMPSGEYIFSEFPDGYPRGFPAWMTDPGICSSCSAGAPGPSAAALAELRELLDGVRTGSLGASTYLKKTPGRICMRSKRTKELPQCHCCSTAQPRTH